MSRHRPIPAIAPLFVLLAIVAPSTHLHAQSCYPELSVSTSYMATNNLAYHTFNRPTIGLAASIWKRTDGEEYWIQRRRNPDFGISFSYAYIPHGIAGNRFGLEGMLRAPLTQRLHYTLGLGLSAYTHPFALTADSNNIFIGSTINCLIDIGLSYNITPHVSLIASLIHTSNGLLYRPNQGLNFLQIALAYRPHPQPAVANRTQPLPTPTFARNEINFALSPAIALSHNISQSSYYFCYDLTLNYMHYLDPVVAIGGALDLWYNFSHPQQYIWYNDPYPIPLYLSALLQAEGFWGPLSIKAGIGPHLLVSSRTKIPIFERVGAYYNIHSHYFGLALHANAGQIEFIEWTYGYRLPLHPRHSRTPSAHQ